MTHFYVDECKANGFRLVAAVVEPSDVTLVRREVKKWSASGARRFHTTKENPQRRTQALAALAMLPVSFIALELPTSKPQYVAREKALRRLAIEALARGVSLMVLEADETVVASDRRLLAQVARPSDAGLRYTHKRAHEEPLLWPSDLVAWALYRGGSWRKAAMDLDIRLLR